VWRAATEIVLIKAEADLRAEAVATGAGGSSRENAVEAVWSAATKIKILLLSGGSRRRI